MNLREEMLSSAGVYKRRNTILKLITEGLFYSSNLDYDLKLAVSNKIITPSESRQLSKLGKDTKEAIEDFYENVLPRMEEIIEERIHLIEGEIEDSTTLEESESFSQELYDLKEKLEKIRKI